MNTPTRILFAVKNPESRRRGALDKTIRIAKRLGARLELFNAISSPVYLDLQPLSGHTLQQLRRESLDLRTRQLEKLAARARKAGVTADVAVQWDFPPHEAIVRRARAIEADLVIAECHEGRRLAPWLLHLTDWELLRDCPTPVLILKNPRAWRRGRVLAAVDPSHAHDKPAQLDAAILAHAAAWSAKMRGSLDVMHANYPSLAGFALGDPSIDAATVTASFESQVAGDKRGFEAFAEKHKIPKRRRHLFTGDPVAAIPAAARSLRADLVVMGAVARSGLKRVLIGNTAERVLNELPCDVLVVKPAHAEHAVAREPRGMRVVAPSPIMPMPA